MGEHDGANGLSSLGEVLASKGEASQSRSQSPSGRRGRAKPKGKVSEQPEKKLLLVISEDQWLGLKRIGLDQRKTLKAVCLDAFDAYIAKHT
jgi:IS4 transposase